MKNKNSKKETYKKVGIGVGLVINVAMRSRAHTLRTPSPQRTARPAKL